MSTAELTATVPDFDETKHAYTLDGRVVPSVTQILEAVMPRQHQPGAWYMGRGSAIHRAIQLAAADQLDMEVWHRELCDVLGDDTARVIRNKTQAAATFLDDSGYTLLQTECRLASKVHQFAGTIDAIAMSIPPAPRTILDWKSSIDPRVELQLGGYAALAQLPQTPYAGAVELRDDGSYRFHLYEPKQVRMFTQEFLSLRSAFGSMQRRGLLPKGQQDGNR